MDPLFYSYVIVACLFALALLVRLFVFVRFSAFCVLYVCFFVVVCSDAWFRLLCFCLCLNLFVFCLFVCSYFLLFGLVLMCLFLFVLGGMVWLFCLFFVAVLCCVCYCCVALFPFVFPMC